MSCNVNYLELVKQAQLGNQKSMSHLAQLVQSRVCAHIYRLTLDYNLAQDLSQETLLQMVKSLKRLNFKHANQFWAWLFRTALGKVQLHFRDQRHKRTVQASTLDKERLSQRTPWDYGDGLKSLINKELSEAIFEAMGKLKLRHRNVLALRCFEQMPYSEIANIMDCSEMASQALFFRAKRSLKRQLSRRGFGKRLLLPALGLFARATAPAEASSATATVTAAATKVGLSATIIGAAGTKLGIVASTAIVATALTVVGITAMNNNPIASPGFVKVTFEYPSSLVGAYDPDNDGWKGIDARGRYEHYPSPVVPDQWLIGPRSSGNQSVVLPTGHWVELKFRSEIVDGPGDDIVLIEWSPKEEQARVFITDGAGNEHLLGIAKSEPSRRQSPESHRAEIGFDISGISLPFVPCAVRIVGMDRKGVMPGFDLCCVRARTKPD